MCDNKCNPCNPCEDKGCKVRITDKCVSISNDLPNTNVSTGELLSTTLVKIDELLKGVQGVKITNVGGGVGLYKGQNVSKIEEFKSLIEGFGILIDESQNEVTISVDPDILYTEKPDNRIIKGGTISTQDFGESGFTYTIQNAEPLEWQYDNALYNYATLPWVQPIPPLGELSRRVDAVYFKNDGTIGVNVGTVEGVYPNIPEGSLFRAFIFITEEGAFVIDVGDPITKFSERWTRFTAPSSPPTWSGELDSRSTIVDASASTSKNAYTILGVRYDAVGMQGQVYDGSILRYKIEGTKTVGFGHLLNHSTTQADFWISDDERTLYVDPGTIVSFKYVQEYNRYDLMSVSKGFYKKWSTVLDVSEMPLSDTVSWGVSSANMNIIYTKVGDYAGRVSVCMLGENPLEPFSTIYDTNTATYSNLIGDTRTWNNNVTVTSNTATAMILGTVELGDNSNPGVTGFFESHLFQVDTGRSYKLTIVPGGIMGKRLKFNLEELS